MMSNPYLRADAGGAIILVGVMLTLGILLQVTTQVPKEDMQSKRLAKRDKVFLIFAGITLLVFSVIPENSWEAVEYVYLSCFLAPFMCWWVLAREKIGGLNNHGN
jgi:cell division protein FtsW (lipid II flippase)